MALSYSVPFEYVGKQVDVEVIAKIVKIYYNNHQIAIHQEIQGKGEFSTIDSHYPKYKRLSDTQYQEKYQIKMSLIGSYAEQIFFLIIQQKKTAWHRTVQGIINLSKKFPKDVINLSCKRAVAYEACDYQTIKNICTNGSYKLPVEFNC